MIASSPQPLDWFPFNIVMVISESLLTFLYCYGIVLTEVSQLEENMTLLVSQVEALHGDIEYPFEHSFTENLYYAGLAKSVLDTAKIRYASEFSVAEGKAYETLDMTFVSVEQVYTFLLFEQRYMVAEARKALTAIPKPSLFRRSRTVHVNSDAVVQQLITSYTRVIQILDVRKKTELSQAVTLS
jgi:hypothetical protein